MIHHVFQMWYTTVSTIRSSPNIMQFDHDLNTSQAVQYGTKITPIRIIENPVLD